MTCICAECDGARPGFITMLLLGVWLATLLFKSAAQTSSARLGILLNFAATYTLLLDPCAFHCHFA
jgi:hypothetical protein